MQLAALKQSHLHVLDEMGVALAIISSSKGDAVLRMAAESPDNVVPFERFYGDPTRRSYALIGARNGFLGVVRGSLSPSRLLEYARDALFIGIVGAVMGATKQHNKTAGADWQQGATALVSARDGILLARAHRDPMDLSQPIEEAARALGRAVTPAMHLDYHGAIATVADHYPLSRMVSRWLLPVVLVVVIVALRWWR